MREGNTCIYVDVPALSVALTSAPCSMREVAKRRSPRMQAVCRGVSPLSLRLCTLPGVTVTSLPAVTGSSVQSSE